MKFLVVLPHHQSTVFALQTELDAYKYWNVSEHTGEWTFYPSETQIGFGNN
jgi:hypothetical protein